MTMLLTPLTLVLFGRSIRLRMPNIEPDAEEEENDHANDSCH